VVRLPHPVGFSDLASFAQQPGKNLNLICGYTGLYTSSPKFSSRFECGIPCEATVSQLKTKTSKLRTGIVGV
jgi:hypothetical protein